MTCRPRAEYIGSRWPTRGTETSKYPVEKKANSDSPSSGERKGKSLNRFSVSVTALLSRGRGTLLRERYIPRRVTKALDSRTYLEWSAIVGDSPVDEIESPRGEHPSTAGHVQSGGNLGGPSSKAKHYSLTDSELVPRGKGEKNPGRGVKENLKPCAYKQWEHYGRSLRACQSVTAYLLHNEPASYVL